MPPDSQSPAPCSNGPRPAGRPRPPRPPPRRGPRSSRTAGPAPGETTPHRRRRTPARPAPAPPPRDPYAVTFPDARRRDPVAPTFLPRSWGRGWSKTGAMPHKANHNSRSAGAGASEAESALQIGQVLGAGPAEGRHSGGARTAYGPIVIVHEQDPV